MISQMKPSMVVVMNKPIFPRLVKLYKNYGHEVRTGLNPHQLGFNHAPFTVLYKDGKSLSTGGGISLQETYFLECLFSEYHPKSIFCIGNAFGWSSLAISMLNPDAKVICIDAGIEGDDNNAGIDLTNRIAHNEGLNLRVIKGFSPGDVGHIVKDCFDDLIDFVFIDGLHTNEQLLKDYNAVSKHIHPDSILLLHDIIEFKMTDAFDQIVYIFNKQHRILHRTESGMGILLPNVPPTPIIDTVNTFTEKQGIVDDLLYKKKPVVRLIRRLGLLPMLNAINKRLP